MRTLSSTPLLDGLRFAEGPRWREGRLWFSEIEQDCVMTVDLGGRSEVVAHVPRPSGLGFLPGGSLLVASMRTRQLFQVDAAGPRTAVDLSAYGESLNDMVVAPDGRAWVDAYRPGPPLSLPVNDDGSPRTMSGDINRYYVNGLGVSPNLVGSIICVDPDGTARPVAEEIEYPNGLGITPDGRTLVASVSHAGQLLAFTIRPDGSLSDRRVWAPLPGRHPDGLCFDAEGAAWVGCVATSAFIRVREGGAITHQVPAPGRWAIAPALGGEDRRTLFMISMEPVSVPGHRAWIDTTRVDVPGAGLP
jgi:sugar lactone lactonase YvrE